MPNHKIDHCNNNQNRNKSARRHQFDLKPWYKQKQAQQKITDTRGDSQSIAFPTSSIKRNSFALPASPNRVKSAHKIKVIKARQNAALNHALQIKTLALLIIFMSLVAPVRTLQERKSSFQETNGYNNLKHMGLTKIPLDNNHYHNSSALVTRNLFVANSAVGKTIPPLVHHNQCHLICKSSKRWQGTNSNYQDIYCVRKAEMPDGNNFNAAIAVVEQLIRRDEVENIIAMVNFWPNQDRKAIINAAKHRVDVIAQDLLDQILEEHTLHDVPANLCEKEQLKPHGTEIIAVENNPDSKTNKTLFITADGARHVLSYIFNNYNDELLNAIQVNFLRILQFGDIAKLKFWLSFGYTVPRLLIDENEVTYFHVAVAKGHIELMQEMLITPHDYHITEGEIAKALAIAANYADESIMLWLLQNYKYDHDAIAEALYCACNLNKFDMAEVIINYIFDNDVNPFEIVYPFLINSLNDKSFDVAEHFLEGFAYSGVYINLHEYQFYPLHIAIAANRTQLVQLLLQLDPVLQHSRDDHNELPIDVAVRINNDEVIKLLREPNAAHDNYVRDNDIHKNSDWLSTDIIFYAGSFILTIVLVSRIVNYLLKQYQCYKNRMELYHQEITRHLEKLNSLTKEFTQQSWQHLGNKRFVLFYKTRSATELNKRLITFWNRYGKVKHSTVCINSFNQLVTNQFLILSPIINFLEQNYGQTHINLEQQGDNIIKIDVEVNGSNFLSARNVSDVIQSIKYKLIYETTEFKQGLQKAESAKKITALKDLCQTNMASAVAYVKEVYNVLQEKEIQDFIISTPFSSSLDLTINDLRSKINDKLDMLKKFIDIDDNPTEKKYKPLESYRLQFEMTLKHLNSATGVLVDSEEKRLSALVREFQAAKQLINAAIPQLRELVQQYNNANRRCSLAEVQSAKSNGTKNGSNTKANGKNPHAFHEVKSAGIHNSNGGSDSRFGKNNPFLLRGIIQTDDASRVINIPAAAASSYVNDSDSSDEDSSPSMAAKK